MAIKKSELYSSLWQSCDELRGGMDASQYKDYVLFMLFIKYIFDKYANSDDFAPPVIIPKGSSFKDMIQLKGKSDIGDKINTQIIQPLILPTVMSATNLIPTSSMYSNMRKPPSNTKMKPSAALLKSRPTANC
jgi:hypothetical protein